MKVQFKKEHFDKLQKLMCRALFENTTFKTKLGQNLTVDEMLHTVSINQLNAIKNFIADKIKVCEEKDEWVEVDTSELEKLKNQKELVNLIIGYKRYTLEKEENERRKKELEEKLFELKESQKTPEDKIKEIESELASFEEF